jgi:TatD DNase family protein
MRAVDTHCHIHDNEFFEPNEAEAVHQRALSEGVAMLCVGTDQPDSRAAVEFATKHQDTWAIVGVHPHEATHGVEGIGVILSEKHKKVVGIGEIGLDFFYDHSPRESQIAALEQHLQWAMDYDLPISFHVREAFDDFWPIFDNFRGLRGVLHSFTDSQQNVDKAFERGLYIGVNGISTFTKKAEQREMFASLPLEKIVVETDAPFLTPVPFRGTINEPSYVVKVAEHIAALKSVPVEVVCDVTTTNARRLFAI